MELKRSDKYYKSLTLKEKAALYSSLIKQPGWELLKNTLNPGIQTRIKDTNTKECFLYEAIRSQIIMEMFALPLQVINQIDKDYQDRHARALNEPMPPIDKENDFLF